MRRLKEQWASVVLALAAIAVALGLYASMPEGCSAPEVPRHCVEN